MRKLFFLISGLTLLSCGKPTICDCNQAMETFLEEGSSFQYDLIREDCIDQFGHMKTAEFDEVWKRECQ
jgi:hypothetical protein